MSWHGHAIGSKPLAAGEEVRVTARGERREFDTDLGTLHLRVIAPEDEAVRTKRR
jgi:hypothetical protein